MAALNLNLSIDQNTICKLLITVTDGVTKERIDLSGYNFQGMIKQKVTDKNPTASFRFQILDQTNPLTKGQVQAYLTAADTLAIPCPQSPSQVRQSANYIYDILYAFGSYDPSKIVFGNAVVNPAVTRPTSP